MSVRIIPVRQDWLSLSEVTVTSHETRLDPGLILVRVIGTGIEEAAQTTTRREGLLELSTRYARLAQELSQLADKEPP